MSLETHPSHDELAGYVHGTLVEELAEAVAEHVETCAECEATVAELERQGDPLMEDLRRAVPADPELDSPECQRALAAAAALEPRDSTPTEAFLGRPVDGGDWAESGSERPVDKLPEGTLGQLGEYQLLEKLGEGGMGAVYKARHTKLDKLVALKVLPRDRMQNPTAVSRFEREMKAVGRLSHPNIVQAFDAREIDGTHFLAMEYVEGWDLAKLVSASGPLRVEDACELVRQAAVGLQHAHEQGLVHRDIKPSNLMLTLVPSSMALQSRASRAAASESATGPHSGEPSYVGRVKILDLGLALLAANQPNRAEMTGAGMAMGTADYISPEQVMDSHSVDIRSDIYSLGCTLYKLLSGRAPFVGPEYKKDMAKMMAHVSHAPPPLRLLRPDVPDGLAAVIERAMAKNPADRFATPAEFADAVGGFTAGADLAQLLTQLPPAPTPDAASNSIQSTDAYPASSFTGTHPSAKPAAVSAPPMVTPKRRGRRPVALVALGLLGLAILAAAMVIRVVTDKGQITITAFDPAVEVVVRRNGQVVDGFQVQQRPDSTSYYSGEYEIEIKGGKPEGVSIKNGKFQLTRGEIVLVEIVREAKLAATPSAKPSTRADEPPTAPPPETRAAKPSLAVAKDGDESPRFKDLAQSPPMLVEPGASLSQTALVSRPAPIPGLRSWTLSPRGLQRPCSLAVSPDGKHIAAGDYCSGTICIYDPQQLRLEKVLVGHDGTVACLAWSADGRFLASGGGRIGDWCLRVWDAESGTLIKKYGDRRWQQSGSTDSLAWSPDGHSLAAGTNGFGDNGPFVLNLTNNRAKRLDTKGVLVSVAWSPDGSAVAAQTSFDLDGDTIGFWHKDGCKMRPDVTGVRWMGGWSPDGRRFAYSTSTSLRIVDGLTCDRPKDLPFPGLPAWSSNGERLLIASIDSLTVLDAGTGTKLSQRGPSRIDRVNVCPSYYRWPAVWVPGSDNFVVVSEGALTVLDSADFSLKAAVSDVGRRHWAHAMLATDGRTLATRRWNHDEVSLWNAESGEFVTKLGVAPIGQGFEPMAFSPTGEWLASGCKNGTLLVDPGQPSRRRLLTGRGHVVRNITWSPDGRRLATTASDKFVRLWDVESGTQRAELAHENEVLDAVWSPEVSKLATLSRVTATVRGVLELWDTISLNRVDRVEIPSVDDRSPRLSWDATGRSLFVAPGQGNIRLYDCESRIPRMLSGKNPGNTPSFGSISYSPATKRLAGGDLVWTRLDWLATGEVSVLPACDWPRWSPDGRRLLARDLGENGNLRVHDTDADSKLGVLLPAISDDQYICIGPDGHYRGSRRIEEHIVYVAQHEDGSQVTYTPKEFSEKFGWKNDPTKARFAALDPPTPPSDKPLNADLAFKSIPGVAPTKIIAEPLAVKPGQPLCTRALVSQPAAIAGLRSWSLELAGFEGDLASIDISPDAQLIAATDAGPRPWGDRAWIPHSARIRVYDRQCRLRRVLLGHDDVVRATAWSPDGRHLASASADRTVRVWDVADGRLLQTIRLASAGLSLRWSPDGQRLAAGCEDGAYMLVVSEKKIDEVAPGRRTCSVLWSPDGQRLGLLSESRLSVVDAKSFAADFDKTTDGGPFTHAAWSPDGRWIAAAQGEQSVCVWDAETAKLVQKLSTQDHAPYAVAWEPLTPAPSPRSTGARGEGSRMVRLVSVGRERAVIWDVMTGAKVAESEEPCRASAVGWSPDGQTIVTACDGRLQVLDAASLRVLRRVCDVGQLPRAWRFASLSPDGKCLATAQVADGCRDTFLLHDTDSGKVRDIWEDTPGGTGTWSPRNDRVAYLGCRDKPDNVAILDVASAQLTNLKSGHTEIARALAWSPDGQRVATGSDDKTAVIWDAAAAMVVKKLEHPCGVIAITWSHDAKWLATGGADQRIRIWDPSVGKLDRTFDPLPMTTSGAGLAWNADDSRLAAALADGSVVLVDVQSGKAGPAVLSVPGTAYDVQWSPDGTMLTASGGDGSAAVCDPQSGKRFDLAARFPGQDIAKTYWLPDSRRILLGCDFATVQQAYDVVADRPLGKMIVRISGDQWIVIGPEGHYRGTRKIDDHIVYVALTDDGRQETYTPSAFAAKFGWKNDPDKAWLLGEPAQQPVPAPMPSGKPQQPEPSSFGQPPAAPKSEPPSKPQAESKVTEPAATAPPSAPAP